MRDYPTEALKRALLALVHLREHESNDDLQAAKADRRAAITALEDLRDQLQTGGAPPNIEEEASWKIDGKMVFLVEPS